MNCVSCAFFGHRNFDYSPYEEKIEAVIVDLINRGVTEFYTGFRGNFDRMCAIIVSEQKEKYPQIKNILVLSYMPKGDFKLPPIFDESVYLLDKRVPLKYAISQTNRKLVETANYIVSGVTRSYGGAKAACDYAKRLNKTIFYIVDDSSYCDYDFVIDTVDEMLKDEQYRKQCEKENAELYEKIIARIKAD